MIAALPMYDFAETAGALDSLWGFVASALRASGVRGVPSTLDRSIDYSDSWTHPALLLGQSCGLPVVAELDGLVEIVGCFSVVDGDDRGTYSSALVVADESPFRSLDDLPWPYVDVAINGWDSLSGYVSLGATVARHVGTVDTPQFRTVNVSGAHVASAALVASRAVHLACIDGHTLATLQRVRPSSLAGLRVIGSGPTIPCLPLITSANTDEPTITALRAALIAFTEEPAESRTREHLGIRGFVACGAEHYEPVRELHRIARSVFGNAM